MIGIRLSRGLSSPDELTAELTAYSNNILEYANDPDSPDALDLMEIASAYLARAYEIQRMLLEQEFRSKAPRGNPSQRFRTGPLDSFIDMAKTMRDLGSRRLTYAKLRFDQERLGHD